MRSRLVIITLLIHISSLAQAQSQLYPKKNMVNGEFGMFHRGIIGASYLRLFIHRERFITGAGGGAGIGGVPGGGGINQFYYGTCYLAAGGFPLDRDGKLYVSASIDFQHIDFHDTEYETIGLETFSNQLHFTLFRVMPYIGITFFEGENINIQMRIPPLAFFQNQDQSAVRWGGVGMSAGVLF